MSTPDIVRRAHVYLGALSLLVAATTGCEKESKKTTSTSKKADTSSEPDTRPPGPSEEAIKKAEDEAVGLAISRFDRARFISSNLEAAEQPDPPAPDPDPGLDQKATGTLSPSALQEVFSEHSVEMQSCYERQLKKNSNLSGRVVLELTIGTDGAVRSARVTGGSLRNGQVHSCLEQNAEAWNFPKPSGGPARVRKPYSFSPKK